MAGSLGAPFAIFRATARAGVDNRTGGDGRAAKPAGYFVGGVAEEVEVGRGGEADGFVAGGRRAAVENAFLYIVDKHR